MYAAGYGVVNYAYSLADIDYLVNSVIYGNQVFTPVSNQSSSQENMKFSKDVQLLVKWSRKKIIIRLVLHQRSLRLKENDDNKNNKKGIKEFFKKFF